MNKYVRSMQTKIWKIANDIRGSVDGWDFKQFVLGTLFFCEIKDVAIKTKGYLIYSSQLFVNIAKTVEKINKLSADIDGIIKKIKG
jgi:type I restriction enzyme M protein